MIKIMDPRFLPHNTHLESPAKFSERDPQLRLLQQQPHCHTPPLLNELPNTAGVYTIGGGRQVGKTTLLKQWMAKLLAEKQPANSIAFFSGELIDDHHALLHLLQTQLLEMPSKGMRYLLIDEVSYIHDWDKAVKYAADAGMLEQVVLMLTGSDLILTEEARARFPGRRGRASKVDFHLHPLSFREVVKLKQGESFVSDLTAQLTQSAPDPAPEQVAQLFDIFNHYLIHGGYLTAINDLAQNGRISEATLMTYSDWIRGDMVKRGKQEHYLREVLSSIIKRYGSQLSWNAIARDLSIDHPKTVADYALLLSSLDALYIQPALLEDKLTAAPKKARKLMFNDPFIFHSLRSWLNPVKNSFEEQIIPTVENPAWAGKLAEAVVTTHYQRHYPTYYIKGVNEIDVAYVEQKRFWPIEVKWTTQLRAHELKQIRKYPNGRIFSQAKKRGEILGIETIPLPLGLLELP
jgi:hypothetical protein